SLELETVGPDRYRAPNAEDAHFIFGGQLMAQSIVAGLAGVDDKRVKTLHIVFARSGSTDAPVEIAVDRVHAGRAFASRTVTMSQGDRLVSRAQVLLTADEPDLIRHADPAPAMTPPPEDGTFGGSGPWQVSIVGDVDISDPEAVGPPDLDAWSRFVGAPD